MRKFLKVCALVLLPLLVSLFSVVATLTVVEFAPKPVEVVRVLDGDTVTIKAPYLPAPLKPELSLRIVGIDTPEKNYLAQCDEERQKGQEATAYTKTLLERAKSVRVKLTAWDKYGGRVLGDLYLDGVSLAQSLIAAGHARAYDGGRKGSWCH